MNRRGRTSLSVVFLALGVGAAYLAVRYRVMPVVALLVAGLGAYSMASGGRMIITRRARVPARGSGTTVRMEHHTGITAQIWGVLFVVYGITALAIAYGLWSPAAGADFGSQLLATPLRSGAAMVLAGSLIGMYGVTRFAGPQTFIDVGPGKRERYFLGGMFCIIAASLVVIGIVRASAPEVLAGFGHRVGELVARAASSR